VFAADARASRGFPRRRPSLSPRSSNAIVPAEIRAIGRCAGVLNRHSAVSITGQLMKTHFKEGDKVKTGDLMFTIDPRPSQAALSQAQADLAQAEAKLEQAQRDWERAQKLGPSERWRNRPTMATGPPGRLAQAALLANRAAVSNAALNLEFTSIRSPSMDGPGTVMIKDGNIIKAEDDQIVTINQVAADLRDVFRAGAELPVIRDRMESGRLGVRS
jgi:multidrug efflux system membrane fusion protein